MFEAIIVLCLGLTEGPCRAHLLPGYEARTQAACNDLLAARPPVIDTELTAKGAAQCQPRGPLLPVEEVANGVFVHEGQIAEPDGQNGGDISNLGFVIGGKSVAVIDAGAARWVSEQLWRAIRARTDLPVSHVILTHMHPDHVLGASAFQHTGAHIVGHANLPRALSDRQANYVESLTRLIGPEQFLGSVAVPVDITVDDTLQIDLGGRILDLRAWPTAHTGTDVTVLDPATATLFAGDLVFHRHTPALDGQLRGWQKVLAEMETLDIQRVIPGHGGPALDWPAGGADMNRYLSKLAEDTRAAINAGQRLGEAVKIIAKDEAPFWDLFDAYNPRNATVAFTELEWE